MRALTLTLVACAAFGCSSSAAPTSSSSSSTASSTSHAASAAPAPSAASAASAAPASPPAAVDLFDVPGGKVVLHPVHHATLYLEAPGFTIWVDPTSEGHLEGTPKADLVLVTDVHGDHLDPKAIALVKKDDAKVVGPKVIEPDVPGLTVLANGAELTVGPVEISAVPMYNLKRGPSAGKLFHDKGRGNGYVLTIGGKRIYLSGDTECTPEMKSLKDIDVAFVCMNLPYTMPPSEAAECVATFKPKVLIPYHYRDSNLGDLDAPLAGKGVEVRKIDFYPR
ncbi:MAG TPA: MBL fold metallo-hydrolase [Polyangiaceae bacterium]|nr:MBL fold metallo-hydrolase [Polyangiaceae bacterium]